MRGYVAFVKKEWMEAYRTYKVFLMTAIFLFLGMMNPLTAKLTPVILENFMPEGMTIQIAEVTALDSWEQFYKNVPQMGLIVLAVMFSGMMANEYHKGTLIPMLTKGLSRSSVVLAKFTVAAVMWTVSYLVCVVVSWGYTCYFLSSKGVNNIVIAFVCLWLFGLMLLAIVTLASVVTNSMIGTLLVVGGSMVVLFVLQLFPKMSKYNPLMLEADNMKLIRGIESPSGFGWSMLVSITVIAITLYISVWIINKKEL